MTQSNAETLTASGGRYMTQLCKHWSHKYPVTFDSESGRIELPSGPLTMQVHPDRLSLTLEAEPEKLEHMKGVVEAHVRRFAFREELVFTWTPAS